MTNRPTNIDNKIATLFVLKTKYIANVLITEKINDKTIGFVNILKLMLLDHLDLLKKIKTRMPILQSE